MKRYIIKRNRVIVDFFWRPDVLNKLDSAGMQNSFMSYKSMMDLLGWEGKNKRRINLLRKNNWLKARKIKQDKKNKIVFPGQKLLYTFSSKAFKYLEKNKSFLNQSGTLIKSIRKRGKKQNENSIKI